MCWEPFLRLEKQTGLIMQPHTNTYLKYIQFILFYSIEGMYSPVQYIYVYNAGLTPSPSRQRAWPHWRFGGCWLDTTREYSPRAWPHWKGAGST
jgi:hypothetical protein